MKKIFSYILISTVMVANLLAPFSMKMGNNYLPKIEKNEASADLATLEMTAVSKGTTIEATVTIRNVNKDIDQTEIFLFEKNPDEGGAKVIDSETVWGKITFFDDGDEILEKTATVSFKDLEESKIYYLYAISSNINIIGALLGSINPISKPSSVDIDAVSNTINVRTGTKDSPQVVIPGSGTASSFNPEASLPACNALEASTWVRGCIVRLVYYAVFVPTSFFFALTGMFFDAAFAYSIQSSSYETKFITEGWGIVRDICNMFFIFVLLYIAFSTILETHGFNTKKTIINVIIIGLFINFSLFAVRIIVDASNIMARVFYNSDAIQITNVSALNISNMVDTPDENGIISISAAIVNKVNPQVLLLKANGNENAGMGGFSTVSYFVIILLASAVNIVGIIVFLSVGLLFVTRVIGLWIAMIISPLAFFSYIVPSMSKQKMIGWENWWPNTLKMAFLAPIFIFFMYIILQFLDKGLGFFDASQESGMTLILAIVIPFAFIMILLWQAKKIATDMSGEMGQSITKGVATVGGLAIAGGALGVAALGRRAIGGTLAKASTGSTSTQKYLAAQGNPAAMAKLSNWEKAKGSIGAKIRMDKVYGKVGTDASGNKIITGGIGKYINDKQKHVGEIDHARHEFDEAKKSAGLAGVKNLTSEDEKKLETTFTKSKRSEVEANVRRGTDNKKDILIDGQKGEDAWKRSKRSGVESDYITEEIRNGRVGLTSSTLDDKDKKNIENKLNAEFNLKLKDTTEKELKSLFEHIKKEINVKIGPLERVAATANKRSFDIRNLSNINEKTDKRDGAITKTGAFLISSIAAGVRMGFKSSNVNYGVGQKDFLTDLKNTLTEALKNIKVDVPKASSGGDHGGGGHGGDDHGGGHH